MKPLDRVGDRERGIIQERRRGDATGAAGPLASHAPVLRALIARLLPGIPDGIDVAGFVDANVGTPLGRGDRPAGTPPETELFTSGLHALATVGFAELDDDAQRALIGRMRRGDADAELGVPAKLFVDRLLDKALTGYLAHPDTWERIGFTGPAYPEGYAWIGPAEAVARRDRKPGWRSL